MTEFRIKAETFLRLANVSLQPNEQHSKYDAVLRSVRIEHVDGVAVAVASCGQLVVAECLHDCSETGAVNVTIDPKLIEIAEAEKLVDGVLIITQAPGWTIARGIETGKMYPLNAEIVGDWPAWRDLVPKSQPSKNNGVFSFGADWLYRLAKSSISETIILPKFADKETPVVLTDPGDPNWFGMILLNNVGRDDTTLPARAPEWLL